MFSIDWTKSFEGVKTPHRKQDLQIGKMNCQSVVKLQLNCFNCEVARTFNSCLDLVSQKKICSTDINMLKRKPAKEYHQMLPYYIGEYEPKQINIDFESVREILMKEDDKMVVLRG